MEIYKPQWKSERIFVFLHNCIWVHCSKSSLLWREYLSSAVSVQTNSPKISDLTKRDVFPLNPSLDDHTIESKFCLSDFSSVFDP